MLLHELGEIDDEEFDLENDGIGRRTHDLDQDTLANHAGENKSDLRDGLVEDPECYPRKRNLLTGMCKTPCEAYSAINPATGRCVTKAYLRTLDFNFYDEDEECAMAANILFSPSIDQSIDATSSEDLKRLIKTSAVTVADARVLRGIYLGSQDKPLVGIYDHKKRIRCEKGYLENVFTSKIGQCGIISPEEFSVDNLVNKINNDVGKGFIWVTGKSSLEVIQELDRKVNTLSSDLRLLIINDTGILRLLVPKNLDIKFAENFIQENLKDISENNLGKTNMADSGINMTIHRFNKLTLT